MPTMPKPAAVSSHTPPVPQIVTPRAEIEDLQGQVALAEGQRDALMRLIELNREHTELVSKLLKLTIQSVERLAKGKSLGALGLPGPEDWDPPV